MLTLLVYASPCQTLSAVCEYSQSKLENWESNPYPTDTVLTPAPASYRPSAFIKQETTT